MAPTDRTPHVAPCGSSSSPQFPRHGLEESQLSSGTFLAFAMRRPHLRAIDLPGEPRFRDVHGSANRADAAFTDIWLRDDWIAIKSHQQLWSLPIPLAGEATHLSSRWDFIPADDGHTVWVPHPRGDCWVRVDGRGMVSGRPLVRRGDERLEAVFGQTALVRDGGNQTLRLRFPDGSDRLAGEGIAICQLGQFALVRSDLGATLSALDLFTGNRTDISRESFGCWGPFAEPSPDGTTVAIGCMMAAAPKPKPPEIAFADWMRHPDNVHSSDDRWMVVLIAMPSLTVTVLDGFFKGGIGKLAWTATGDGFIFLIPFQRNSYAWVDSTTRAIQRVKGPLQSPVPLCDATSLLGRGID